VRLVVDTGVFSAALSRRRRAHFDEAVKRLAGNQLFLAAVTVAELRYGALVAGWGTSRRARLEQAIEATTVIPVSDALAHHRGPGPTCVSSRRPPTRRSCSRKRPVGRAECGSHRCFATDR